MTDYRITLDHEVTIHGKNPANGRPNYVRLEPSHESIGINFKNEKTDTWFNLSLENCLNWFNSIIMYNHSKKNHVVSIEHILFPLVSISE